jgi:hypothetical protein
MKKPSPKARGKALRPKPFEDNKVDFSKFKMEPSASDIAKLAAAGGTKVWPVHPIEVLSPAKTVGLGRTTLSLSKVNGFTTNATTPFAEFRDDPPFGGSFYIWLQFEPSAYGITSVATYVITFNLEASGNAAFEVFGLGVTVSSAYLFSGSRTLQVVFPDWPPSIPTWPPTPAPFAVLRQRARGVTWKWYSSVIKFPDTIVVPPL